MKDSAVSMEQGVWFTAREGELYFHPSDEGFPLIAMMKYGSLEPDEMRRKEAMDLVAQAFVHVLSISGKPFGYAAFTQKMGETETRRYFFPHDTKAAPGGRGKMPESHLWPRRHSVFPGRRKRGKCPVRSVSLPGTSWTGLWDAIPSTAV